MLGAGDFSPTPFLVPVMVLVCMFGFTLSLDKLRMNPPPYDLFRRRVVTSKMSLRLSAVRPR